MPRTYLRLIAALLISFSSVDAAEPMKRFHLAIDREEGHGISLRSDGKLLLLAGKKVTLGFDPKTGRELFREETPDLGQSYGPSIAQSPDGKLVAFSGMGNVRLYSVDPLKLTKELDEKPDDSHVGGFAFSHDGKRLAGLTAQWRGKKFVPVVHVWDVASGKILQSFDHEVILDCALKFSPNGNDLFSTDLGMVTYFDLDKGKGPSKLILKVRHDRLGDDVEIKAPSKIALHPDGKQFVLADPQGLFLLDNISNRKVLAKRWQFTAIDDDGFEYAPDEGESEEYVVDVAYTRDGKALLSLQDRDEKDTMRRYLIVRDPKSLRIRSMHLIPSDEDADAIHIASAADVIVTSGSVAEPDRMCFQVWDGAALVKAADKD